MASIVVWMLFFSSFDCTCSEVSYVGHPILPGEARSVICPVVCIVLINVHAVAAWQLIYGSLNHPENNQSHISLHKITKKFTKDSWNSED